MKGKMRSQVLAVLMLAAVVASCEKIAINEGDSAEKTSEANVVLRISQFEQIPFPATTRAEVGNVCTRLNFAVYNENGTKVKQINQISGDVGFGQVSMTLAEGNYQLVVLAHSSSGNPTMTNAAKITFSNSLGFSDTFLYYGDLSVTEDRQDIALSLRRVTAMFRFYVEDEFPAAVKQFRFYYTGGSGTIDATTGYGNVNSKQVTLFDVDGSQKQFDIYTFLHDETGSLNITVSAYDGATNVLKEREFKDVPMQRNMITRYSGDFFTGTTGDIRSMSFGIEVDDAWGGEKRYSY